MQAGPSRNPGDGLGAHPSFHPTVTVPGWFLGKPYRCEELCLLRDIRTFGAVDKALPPALGKQSSLISGTLSGHLRGEENSA